MLKKFILVWVGILALGITGLALAEEEAGYMEHAGEELVEGIEDTLTGSLQVPAEMLEAAEENPVEAVTVAPIKGAKETVLQTTEGAIRTGTFFLPEDSGATSTPQ